MRSLIVLTSLVLILGPGCSSLSGGTGNAPVGAAEPSVNADQARQIIQAAGYLKIGPIERSKDDGAWEATAMIDGVPYVVDVDNDGLLVAR